MASERTDGERFAWLFLHGANVEFYNVDKKGVLVWDWLPKSGLSERSIKSSKHAHAAWRKCVDELMDNDQKGK